jgi:hypothetical protein
MIAIRVAVKSPFYPPFSKGELFSTVFIPSLEKRGMGRFVDAVAWELCSELLSHHTSELGTTYFTSRCAATRRFARGFGGFSLTRSKPFMSQLLTRSMDGLSLRRLRRI